MTVGEKREREERISLLRLLSKKRKSRNNVRQEIIKKNASEMTDGDNREKKGKGQMK